MATKERNQNLVVNDTARLRLHVLNSNIYSDVQLIDSVKIYFLDPTAKTDANPDGRTLFATIATASVVHEATGKYYVDLPLTSPSYVIGKYVDVWNVVFDNTSVIPSPVENNFQVYPNLWVTSDKPLIYNFDFRFSPNRITSGSIEYLTVEVNPIVPRATSLEKYYQNLAIVSDVSITIVQKCGPCLPVEEDLRTVVDNVLMTFKDKNKGYYLLDTTDMNCGIYDVTFKLVFGDTTHYSTRQQLEIFR